MIVDDAVVVSSTNRSENSVSNAREAGMLIHSAAVTAFFAGMFDDDWLDRRNRGRSRFFVLDCS